MIGMTRKNEMDVNADLDKLEADGQGDIIIRCAYHFLIESLLISRSCSRT